MGQTGFCEILRFSADSCENLRFPAVFCENLRLRNAIIPRKKRKSAKISENQRKTAKSTRFVPFSLSLLIPLDTKRLNNPGPPKPERRYTCQNRPFTKPPLCYLSIDQNTTRLWLLLGSRGIFLSLEELHKRTQLY